MAVVLVDHMLMSRMNVGEQINWLYQWGGSKRRFIDRHTVQLIHVYGTARLRERAACIHGLSVESDCASCQVLDGAWFLEAEKLSRPTPAILLRKLW